MREMSDSISRTTYEEGENKKVQLLLCDADAM
jgi:hypothetical protein